MPPKRKEWLREHDLFIINNADKMSYSEISQKIGLTRSSIRDRHEYLKLKLVEWVGSEKGGKVELTPQEKELVEAYRRNNSVHAAAKADIEYHKLKQAKSELEAKYSNSLKLAEELQTNLVKSLELKEVLETANPKPIEIIDSGKQSQSVAFMVASDWHLEEHVDPISVENINHYDLQVADERVQNFFRNGLKLIEMCRHKSNIETLVLAVIGDIITGYIHDELIESNLLSPTEAILKGYEWLKSGIDFLLEHGEFSEIIIPTCYGNHGRTTQKPRISTGAFNSYEWLMYQFLHKAYIDDSRVRFKVASSYFNYLKVYGYNIRFHHGDGIKYMGGVGDVDVPLNKAIAQWNKAQRADLDVLGHWHTRKASRNFVMNGSLIGYNAYSIRIKASYEPPCQSFFLMHPEYGKTIEAPIFVSSSH